MTAETIIFMAKILASGLLFLGICFIAHRLISKNKALYFPKQSYEVCQMIAYAVWFIFSSPAIEQYFGLELGEAGWRKLVLGVLFNITLLIPFIYVEAHFLKRYKLPADRNSTLTD